MAAAAKEEKPKVEKPKAEKKPEPKKVAVSGLKKFDKFK